MAESKYAHTYIHTYICICMAFPHGILMASVATPTFYPYQFLTVYVCACMYVFVSKQAIKLCANKTNNNLYCPTNQTVVNVNGTHVCVHMYMHICMYVFGCALYVCVLICHWNVISCNAFALTVHLICFPLLTINKCQSCKRFSIRRIGEICLRQR